MTIEEDFFKVFGVDNCSNCDRKNSLECYYCDNKYPEITAEILLKLICIYTRFFDIGDNVFKDTKDLKNFILQGLMLDVSTSLKRQVRALFEGGEGEE